MSSKILSLEGLPDRLSVSKLVFHILEFTKLKKHQLGRITPTPSRFDIELLDCDQDDLKKVIQALDGLEIDNHLLLAWSKDLHIPETIQEHFKNLEKWQNYEIEESLSEQSFKAFARLNFDDYEPALNHSFDLYFNKSKTYEQLDRPPKPGQPLILNAQQSPYQLLCSVKKWSDDACILNADHLPQIENWEQLHWELSFSQHHIGMERALLQAQRVPYQLNEQLENLFQLCFSSKQATTSLESIKPITHTLNASQTLAYEDGLSQNALQLIQGPPGTGKSRVLIELLKTYSHNNLRVLVASSSNSAVDHLLSNCGLPEDKLLRLGHHSRISKSCHSYSLDSKWKKSESFSLCTKLKKEHQKIKQQLYKAKGEDKKLILKDLRDLEKSLQKIFQDGRLQLLTESPIVFTTHTGFQPLLLKGHRFDIVIVDEAAQCSEIDTWLTLPWGSKWVLAGDPCQLPSLIKSPKAQKLSISLMERLIQIGHTAHLLEEQYRMHESIAHYSSITFYDGKLKVANEQQQELIKVPKPKDDLFWLDHPQIFVDTAGSEASEETIDHSYQNDFEAQFLSQRVKELIDSGIEAQQIGIISPYRAQSELLQSYITNEGIEIKNIDAFQGREKDIIFISCVRSNQDGQIGFLSDTRRMNVAMTRAKKLCLMIGDSATLSNHEFYENFISWKENDYGLHSVWEWS